MSIAFKAMQFAREVHAGQKRKYTGNPYTDHLAEVAGIVSTVSNTDEMGEGSGDVAIAVSWLHDCVEDQGITVQQLGSQFGMRVARGVMLLSDLEVGNRAERKAASRARLASAPGWIQTIKCADIISNASSIVMHDPKFAVTYLEEKRLLLEAMNAGDKRLYEMARSLCK